MRSLSLFAGVGRSDAALESLGIPTAAFSETDEYASAVMRKRFPGAVEMGDVRGFTGNDVRGIDSLIDVITGGFPCQDISNAGKREGITGARSSLWGEYARLIGEIWPRLVFIENVSALLARGLDVVLRDLYNLGYACEWDCIPAAAVGAPHLRDRIWMVAYPDSRNPLHVFGEERLEKSLGLLEYPPSKWPRAGRMEQGGIFVKEPIARRKTKRVNDSDSSLWATPSATMADRGGRGDLIQQVRGNWNPHFGKGTIWVGECLSRDWGWWHGPTFPTPSATSYGSNRGGAAGRVGPVRHSLESMARHGMWPTPTRSDGAGGPGSSGRQGGPNLRTAVGSGQLNANWVEWMMGMPVGTTDLDCEAPVAYSWDQEPEGIPRVTEGQPNRKQRLTACGNAQVQQVQEWVARRALERL